jgi:hypothetical protein
LPATVELSELLDRYEGWLARQPLAERTRRRVPALKTADLAELASA